MFFSSGVNPPERYPGIKYRNSSDVIQLFSTQFAELFAKLTKSTVHSHLHRAHLAFHNLGDLLIPEIVKPAEDEYLSLLLRQVLECFLQELSGLLYE